MEQWIKFGQRYVALNKILSEDFDEPCNNFEKSIIQFCKEWLNGKRTFSLQTSGSTGLPKKITATRDQLIASAKLTAKALGLVKNSTALVCLDTRYIAGIMMMVRSLEVGMNMIVVEPASNPLEKMEDGISIDFTALVPLQLETILRSPHAQRLNHIKTALIGGAALHPKIANELNDYRCHFYATYGMTETLSHVALQKLNGKDAQDYFEILSGITISTDHRNCLLINAPHIHSEPIVTNDLVELLTPTTFRWLGRADTIINSGGVKVIPEKIEACVSRSFEELNLSNHFFVAALPDEVLGQSVNLFIEGNPFQPQIEDLINQKLKVALSRYERPKSIRYILPFNYTDSGKIDKIKTLALISK